MFAHTGFPSSFLHHTLVKAGQRLVHIAHVAELDLGRALLQPLPDTVADHLQLDRFHVGTEHRAGVLAEEATLVWRRLRARARLWLRWDFWLVDGHLDPAQVVHQPLGHALAKGTAGLFGRLAHGLDSTLSPQALHAEAGLQPLGEVDRVGVEPGHVILAQGQDDAQPGHLLEGLANLGEKVLDVLPAVPVGGEHLLKLVQDQNRRRLGSALPGVGLDLGQVGKQGVRQQIPGGRPLAGQAHEGAKDKEVGHLGAGDAGWRIAGHAHYGQHVKAPLLEIRDHPRVEQRRLARARLGVEQHDPLGQDQREQVARFPGAPVKVPVLLPLEGAGADVGVVSHGCPSCQYSRSSAANWAVVPQ